MRRDVATLALDRPTDSIRTGAPYWLDGYRAMVGWQLASLRLWLPVLAAIQILAGAGFVLGIALFFAQIPPSAALYVSTGVPVINLVMVGLILGPQLVADQKVEQSYEFLQTLPVRRTATALAWYTVTLIGGLPAVVVSLLIAQARYHIAFAISPSIVPAVLLTAFTGTMLGYALAHALADPMTTRLITQLLVFVIFGYAPILFPPWQMPAWLAAVNSWLPFRPMATIVRGGLTDGMVGHVAGAYLVVAVWGAAGAAVSAWALGRRR
jgi:ABC-2 type transport system permease protein